MNKASLGLTERVARDCGMTRLADITGLDRIGIPCWQAVRPWSRSLSVHQGKGLSADHARIGACMEAIECAYAEDWRGDTHEAAFDALPPHERAPFAQDYSMTGDAFDPAVPIVWTPAERIGGGVLWVPFASVSLDFTVADESGVERTSSGQGAGFDLAWASLKALCELIERDAIVEWRARGLIACSMDGIDQASIDFPWFRTILETLRALGIALRIYRVPAAIPMPVIAVELIDHGPEALAQPWTGGTCAHWDAEAALKGALLEAAQARLTEIAGARDDLPLGEPEARAPTLGLGLVPPGIRLPGFDALFAPAPASEPGAMFDAAVEALARAGYPIVARVDLSPPGSPVKVAKMFAPGLGALHRRRRR